MQSFFSSDRITAPLFAFQIFPIILSANSTFQLFVDLTTNRKIKLLETLIVHKTPYFFFVFVFLNKTPDKF